MKTRRARSIERGMTLVEVLLSLAILSAMASAVVPLLRDSLRSLDPNGNNSARDLFDLSTRADQLVEDHRTGSETDVDLNELESGTPQTIAWPEPHSDRPPIVVQRLERTSPSENSEKSENSGRGEAEQHRDPNHQEPESIGHGWWVFEWRGLAVFRWIPANERAANEKATKE